MLVELGVVEQRYQAVLEVLGGASVTDVARRYGVARQTVHGWLRRYATDGLAGLVDRSSKPDSCPHQTPVEVEVRIVEMRRAHPGWGPRTIGYHLEREGVAPVPSRSSIYRTLIRHGLIDPQQRRKRRSDYRRWERSRSMELWQMDIMGGVRLVDGSDLKLVTGIDDHSRFCVSAKAVRRATARPVCDALAEAMRSHGVPDQILTDNGKVFTGRFRPLARVISSRRRRDRNTDPAGVALVERSGECSTPTSCTVVARFVCWRGNTGATTEVKSGERSRKPVRHRESRELGHFSKRRLSSSPFPWWGTCGQGRRRSVDLRFFRPTVLVR